MTRVVSNFKTTKSGKKRIIHNLKYWSHVWVKLKISIFIHVILTLDKISKHGQTLAKQYKKTPLVLI